MVFSEASTLVLVGGDGQDARAIHGSSRSATVHPSAFVPNGPRLVVVAIVVPYELYELYDWGKVPELYGTL